MLLYFTSANEIDVAPFVFTPNLPFPEFFSAKDINDWLVTLDVTPLTVTDKVSLFKDIEISNLQYSVGTLGGKDVGIFSLDLSKPIKVEVYSDDTDEFMKEMQEFIVE